MRLVLAVLMTLPSAAHAQAPRRAPVPVLQQPFTAQRVVTSTRQLADGTRIEHVTTSDEARDSSGRTWSHYEVRQDPLRPGPKQYITRTYDPNSRIESQWCTCRNIVTITHFAEPRPQPPEHSPGPEGMDVYLGPSPTERLKYHGEDLPGQIIQGVNTRGSKVVRTVPAGTDGNSRDLTTTILSWYSPELRLAIVTIIDDPIQGLRKLEFVNLKRSEPGPDLFQVPPGYTIREAH